MNPSSMPRIRAESRRTVALLTLQPAGDRAESRWLALALTELLHRALAAGGRNRVLSGKDVSPELPAKFADPGALPLPSLQRMRARWAAAVVISGTCQVDVDAVEGSVGLKMVVKAQDAKTGALRAHVIAAGPDDAAALVNSVVETLHKQLRLAAPAREPSRRRAPSLRHPRRSPARARAVREASAPVPGKVRS